MGDDGRSFKQGKPWPTHLSPPTHPFSSLLTLLAPPAAPPRHAATQKYITLIDNPPDIQDGHPFPPAYRAPLARLWSDPGVQLACSRGHEYALPENLP